MKALWRWLMAFGCAALAASAQAQVQWDMPTGYPASNFHTENIEQFRKDVEQATGGRLKIVVHAAGSLFKANEIKRAVQGGQVPIGEIIISGFSNEDPLFGLDSIPFLATSYEDARRLWRASKEAIDARFARQGMKILYTVPWQPQGIYSAKPINSADDLKGMKWRAYNPQTSRIAQLVGAQPVTIQAAELSQALATGAVEAFMTSSATGYDSKVWEQVQYFYDVRAWLPKNAVIVNQRAFDKLDAATRQAVLKAAAAAEERGWKASTEKNDWYLEQLRAHMKVEKPSAQLQADMRKVGETMIQDWIKQTGKEGEAILDAYGK
ncbi:MAG TPA: TRAP transporter substrate-binding protein [Burkholderiales bacterium]